MLRRLLAILKTRLLQVQKLNRWWLIIGLFAIVITLDLYAPPPYALGLLYIGAILLASSRHSHSAILQVTVVAIGLTILNLFFPSGVELGNRGLVANRVMTVMALVVTGLLRERTLLDEQAIAQQQTQLQAQDQLTRVREDFVSTLTHDLKTPLLGAIEALKLLQQENFGTVTSAQQKLLETMTRSHRNSLQLIETLLDIYRNDTEGLKLKLAPVDLVALAEEAMATLTNLAEMRQVEISLSDGASNRRSLWVNGDALQLQRVFSNLLTNAINHSAGGGRVEFDLETDSAYQVVKVLDSGQGIKDDELPHLFERFYQGHSHRQGMGSGLGLYLTRQIIEAHGGSVWATNRSLHGALFGFRLPRHEGVEQV